jgi:hypothetical protein
LHFFTHERAYTGRRIITILFEEQPMRQPRAHWILSAGFVASVLLATSLGKRSASPTTPPVPLNDWDVLELAVYLNRAGIRLHVVSTVQAGGVQNTAFLTTTNRTWHELNHLTKNAKLLDRWQGILYCERVESDDIRKQLADQWGELGWSAGPFVFYGDPELLSRVRAVLLDAPLGTLSPLRFAIVIDTMVA